MEANENNPINPEQLWEKPKQKQTPRIRLKYDEQTKEMHIEKFIRLKAKLKNNIEIAEKLGVSLEYVRTLSKLAKKRVQLKLERMKRDNNYFLEELIENYENRLRYIMTELDICPNPIAKAMILRAAIENDKIHVSTLQSLGVLKREETTGLDTLLELVRGHKAIPKIVEINASEGLKQPENKQIKAD